MKKDRVFKRVYFHAVRRAMQENETLMRKYVDNIAITYDESTLEKLDAILVAISDNDLFDLIMGHKSPTDFKGIFDENILTDIVCGTKS